MLLSVTVIFFLVVFFILVTIAMLFFHSTCQRSEFELLGGCPLPANSMCSYRYYVQANVSERDSLVLRPYRANGMCSYY
jgi:hypothetical protein